MLRELLMSETVITIKRKDNHVSVFVDNMWVFTVSREQSRYRLVRITEKSRVVSRYKLKEFLGQFFYRLLFQ